MLIHHRAYTSVCEEADMQEEITDYDLEPAYPDVHQRELHLTNYSSHKRMIYDGLRGEPFDRPVTIGHIALF